MKKNLILFVTYLVFMFLTLVLGFNENNWGFITGGVGLVVLCWLIKRGLYDRT